jgi:glycogen debranching enzyme
MKRVALRLLVATLCLAVGVACFFALSRLRQQNKRERVKAAAVRLTNQFHEAVFNGDTHTLNDLLADDFKGIGHTSMGVFTVSKGEQIASAKASKEAQEAAGKPVPSITLTNVSARDEGAKIVVEADAIARMSGERDFRRHLVYTFVEQGGRLQLLSTEFRQD